MVRRAKRRKNKVYTNRDVRIIIRENNLKCFSIRHIGCTNLHKTLHIILYTRLILISVINVMKITFVFQALTIFIFGKYGVFGFKCFTLPSYQL